jgi:phosphoenolpyruvate carboxykinase (ATP)
MMSEINLELFEQTAARVRQQALEENRLIDNPSREELRSLVASEPGIRNTIYNNYVANSEPTSRAALFTKNSVDHSFGTQEAELLQECENALATQELISIDRVVGNEQSSTTVRLIVPRHFAHVAYGGGNLFSAPKGKVDTPTYEIVMFTGDSFEANKSKPLKEKDIAIRLAMLDDGRVVKIVKNSNYIGEYKKGVFAAEDWVAKTKRGGIFLHAGCREDYLQSAHGDYQTSRTLLIALSANGKTSTTCRILARKGNEKSWLIQDDGGTLMPDGSFQGFEAGGIFVKTEGANPGDQTEVYYGLLKPETLCENVYVTEDGDMDFYNFQRTSNGRAVMLRRDFFHASQYIDVDRVDNIALITRGPLIPAISRLTLEQAVALMVLGQSIESSAGDPSLAGKIKGEFFYDPFVAGDRSEHTRIFYEIVRGLPDLHFYLLNTGGVGEGEHYQDIRLEQTIGILDSLLRGGLEDWIDSPTGFKVPKAIRSVDDIYLHPEKLYSALEFEEKQRELDQTRRTAIEKVGSLLPPSVRSVFAG